MFLRAILLLAMSSTTWGAGVTIDVDIDVSIEEIRYEPVVTDDMSTGYIDSTWLDVEGERQALDAFQYLTINHPNTRIGNLRESPDRELNALYMNGLLNAIRINEDGSQVLGVYPPIENAIGSYGMLLNGVPYVLDTENNLIWQWETDYWMDLSASKEMPAGEYVAVTPYGNGYLLSTDSNDEATLWYVGGTTQAGGSPLALSTVSWPSESGLVYTSLGYLQIFSENLSSYTGHWLGAGKSDFQIDVNAVDFPYYQTAIASTGIFINFYSSNNFQFYWLPSSDELDSPEMMPIELPNNWRTFNGCFTAYPKIFCVFNVQDVGFSLYELEGGEFVLDSQLNEAVSGKTINGVYSVGKNRFISAYYNGTSGNYSYLYSINEDGIETTMKVSRSSLDDPYYIHPSSYELGQFYWVGKGVGATNIYKAEASGDFAFDRNLDSIVPIESPVEGSSAEGSSGGGSGGSGSMPTYLLAMLFMLLLPSVRWRQVSGV